MTKQLVKSGVAVMATLLALFVFWQFRVVVGYVLISLTLAATLRPLVNRLVGRRLLARIAWILLYLVALAGFGFVFFLTSKIAVDEIQQLVHSISAQDQWTLPIWLEGSSFQQVLLSWLPPPSKLFEAVTGSQGQLVLPVIFGFTQDIAGVVSGLLVVLFLSLYWIINQIHFERLWLSLLPSAQRSKARNIWRTIEPDLGAYIRSQLAHGLLVWLLLSLGYWVIGSPYSMMLGLFSALACLIPVVGSVLAVFPPLLVGLLTGVQLSLFTVLYTLITLIALGVWVKPRLFNRRWDNPILTLVILLALGNAFGLIGIIVAPPLSAVCQILWNLLVSHPKATGAACTISDLQERQERIWVTIRTMEEPPIPLVTSSLERLNNLILKAEPLFQTVQPVQPSSPFFPAEPVPEPKRNNDLT